MAQWKEWSSEYADRSQGYDGVSTQAIAASLFPEFTATRTPNDSAVKTGLVSRIQTYTLTTNSSGNAGFVLFPNRVTQTSWIVTYNDSTFNPDSGH